MSNDKLDKVVGGSIAQPEWGPSVAYHTMCSDRRLKRHVAKIRGALALVVQL